MLLRPLGQSCLSVGLALAFRFCFLAVLVFALFAKLRTPGTANKTNLYFETWYAGLPADSKLFMHESRGDVAQAHRSSCKVPAQSNPA
jgi:hypothetical protein